MARVAAFLRGINLGNRRLKMDELRAVFEELGYSGVDTFLASGNVVFEAPEEEGLHGGKESLRLGGPPQGEHPLRRKAGRASPGDLGLLEAAIEAHLERSLGYPVDTFIRSLDVLAELVGRDGLQGLEAEGFKPQVLFLKGPAVEEAADALAALEGPDDRFLNLEREVVWLRRGRLSDAPFPLSELQEALGGGTQTMRTLNTVRRMVRRFEGSAFR